MTEFRNPFIKQSNRLSHRLCIPSGIKAPSEASTYKVLFHKLQLVVLAVLAFLVGELVLVRGALAGMKVAVALPVPHLPVPLDPYPFGVASLVVVAVVVVAVLGPPWRSMPAGRFLPTGAPRQPPVPSFGHPRVHRVMPQKQRGLLPSVASREREREQTGYVRTLPKG